MTTLARPSLFFHLGAPCLEEPHRNNERVDRFLEKNPDIRFVVIVWDQISKFSLEDYLKGKNAEVWYWDNDVTMMDRLMDNLGIAVGAQLTQPTWYTCKEGHISPSTGKELRSKCVQCENTELTVNLPCNEKFKEFADLFLRVIQLANFDTSSGEFLYAAVNPTKNLMLNMRYAIKRKDVVDPYTVEAKDLMGTGQGKTGILIGAGPSLEDAIPKLQKLSKTDAVICCVGRSFKLLRQNNIRVDYVLSCEMFDWDAAIFEGVDWGMAEDTTLAFASVCSPKTLETWPGKRVCMWDAETAKILGREDWIMGGNSVAHHMLNFAAQALKCSPLILVGVDLAYTKPKTHAEGTHHEWPQNVKDQELSYQAEAWVISEGKGNEFHPECHRTAAALGRGGFAPSRIIEVRSSPAYKNFATLFEILIRRHGVPVYNACSNGQKIIGAPYMDLEVLVMAEDRLDARYANNHEMADKLRDTIKERGWEVIDGRAGREYELSPIR